MICGLVSHALSSRAWDPPFGTQPSQDGDLLEVCVDFHFRDPIIHLVAISDPTFTADGPNLQAKVLWEAPELTPYRTGGSSPPEIPWGWPIRSISIPQAGGRLA